MLFEILGGIALFLAFIYVLRPFVTKNENFEDGGNDPDISNSDVAKFYFFYTTWCGWSKKAWPHWEEFKRMVETRKVTYGNKGIKLIAVDADQHKDLAKQFNVEGYPSFRLQTNDTTIDFKGAPSVDSFREFLKSKLGYEMVE